MSLFTKILVDEAIEVIKYITDRKMAFLVQICLKATYYSFYGNIYDKVEGVVMESPLCPGVSNLYM